MVHGGWSSCPTAGPQGLLIRHWWSWTPDQLFVLMRDTGFHSFRVTYFDTTMHLGYENVLESFEPGVGQSVCSNDMIGC